MMTDEAKFCRQCGAMLDVGRPRCPACNAAVRQGGPILGFFSGLLALLKHSPIRFNVELHCGSEDTGGARLLPVDWQVHKSTHCDVDRIELRRPDGSVQRFGSLDDVPAEIRELLQRHLDEVRAGEGAFEASSHAVSTTVDIVDENGARSEEYTHTGDDGVKRTYRSLDEMPPDVRNLFDKDGDNRPDLPCLSD